MKLQRISKTYLALIFLCVFVPETGFCAQPNQSLKSQYSIKQVVDKNTRFAIGFIVKYDDPKAADLALELAQLVLSEGAGVVFAPESKTLAEKLAKHTQKENQKIRVIAKDQLPEHVRAIVVLGGKTGIHRVPRAS